MYAQNLVPNGDFESISRCPSNYKFNTINNWFNPTGSLQYHYATPDYFNKCANDSLMGMYWGMPQNWAGYENAHSGDGYCHICLYGNFSVCNNFREYIEIKLNNPLQNNRRYILILYVSKVDSSNLAIDRFGAAFTKDSLIAKIDTNLNFQPQIETPEYQFFTKTKGWTEIKQTYIAKGGEQFLTLGNFRNNKSTHLDTIMPVLPPNSGYSYEERNSGGYFIDDVSLTLDTTYISGIKENPDQETLHPHFTNNILKLTLTEQDAIKFDLYDIQGQLLYRNEAKPEQEIPDIKTGLYLLRIYNSEYNFIYKVLR